MRFLLLVHGREADRLSNPPEWSQEVAAFLVKFKDQLAINSEFDWSELLAPETQAIAVGPGGVTRNGTCDVAGQPLHRMWAVRVDNEERVRELAAQLADALDTWVEVRECLTSSHRP